MRFAGFAVTKLARRATRLGGSLTANDKARANRRNRHQAKQELHARGVDADIVPRLWTDYDVC